MKRFTHKATLYGFRCYYNPDTNECMGMTWIEDVLIDAFIWLAMNVFDHDGFLFQNVEELEETK